MSAHRFLAVAIVLLATLGLVSPIRAQPELSEVVIIVNPYSRQSIENAKRILDLDAEQLAGLQQLFSGYQAAVKARLADAKAKHDEAEEKSNESDAPDAWQAARKASNEITRKFMTDARALAASLTTDFKALLTPAQLDRFPAFERARRRESSRYIQMMAGENADLVSLLDSLAIAWRSAKPLAEALEKYELSLDRLLQERQKLFDDALERSFRGGGEENIGKELLPKLFAQAKAVRDTHRQGARTIADLLPPADKDRFTAVFRERAYPLVYAPSRVAKTIDHALKLEGITDAQKTQLAELRATYQKEADPINARWASALDAGQDALITSFEKILMGDEDAMRPVVDADAARRDLDSRFLDRVNSILTEAQRQALPPLKPERRRGQGGLEPTLDRDAIKEWTGDDHEEDDADN